LYQHINEIRQKHQLHQKTAQKGGFL